MTLTHDRDRTESSRRRFLRVAGLGAAAMAAGVRLPGAAAGAARERTGRGGVKPRHVLLLSFDDMNPSLGCYGVAHAVTPNLDAVAARGVRFTRAFCDYPSCLPSRVSFLSGWSPERTGMYDFDLKPREGKMAGAVYLPQHLRSQGWRTGRVDKVFHIGRDDAPSWDWTREPFQDAEGRDRVVYTPGELEFPEVAAATVARGRFAEPVGERGEWVSVDLPDEALADGRTAALGVRFLEEAAGRAAEQPFFLALGFRRPHLPWIAPRRWFDHFRAAPPPLPPEDPGAARRLPEVERRAAVIAYHAALAFADEQAGRVLDALRRLGLEEETLVVVLGDNGYAFGQRASHWGKGGTAEASYRVPLILSGAGVGARGQACGGLVTLLDLYPTVTDLLGVAGPSTVLDGRSLAPLLADPSRAWVDAVSGCNAPGGRSPLERTLRTARHRYSESRTGEPAGLYDLEADPWEWSNLVADPSRAPLAAQMRARLRREVERFS